MTTAADSQVPPARPGERLLDIGAFAPMMRLFATVWGYRVVGCNKPSGNALAVVELEQAHWVYDRCRDALAVELVPASMRGAFRHIEPNSAEVYEDRVRAVAQLLWESVGRPEGTADDDWIRAEQIVRLAATA